jgi:hypothetical protein
MESLAHNPTTADVSMATTDLLLSIQREFPQAQINAHPPYDDEDICLKVYLPGTSEEIATAQRRVIDLAVEIQDKYHVYTVVMVLPR